MDILFHEYLAINNDYRVGLDIDKNAGPVIHVYTQSSQVLIIICLHTNK